MLKRVSEVEAGADENQQIKFAWPYVPVTCNFTVAS